MSTPKALGAIICDSGNKMPDHNVKTLHHKNRRVANRLVHLPRRLLREALKFFQLAVLFAANRLGKRLVNDPSGPVVSLTTYGKRSDKVYYAIESIARGDIRPSRLILWIDDERLINDLPATIRRLQSRGLEVKACRNYGPHKKYYPCVESENNFSVPLVTADDDILYPHYWLKNLALANLATPDMVCCYWAVVVPVDICLKGKLPKFLQCKSMDASFRYIAQGGMGAIYPPQFLFALKSAGTHFEFCCPMHDDYWLHLQALRAGFKVRQIIQTLPYYSFFFMPGTQKSGLCKANVDQNQREWQFLATYTDTDIQRLK